MQDSHVFCDIRKLNQKQEMYLQAEPHLTISDFKEVEKNIKKLSMKNSQLEKNLMIYALPKINNPSITF